MLVTVTNVSAEDVFVNAFYRVLRPGQAVTVSRSRTDLEMESELKKHVAAGTLVLSFVPEPEDDAAMGTEAHPSFSDLTRPAPADWPVHGAIWNTSDNALNWSDGVNWRDAAGAIT